MKDSGCSIAVARQTNLRKGLIGSRSHRGVEAGVLNRGDELRDARHAEEACEDVN